MKINNLFPTAVAGTLLSLALPFALVGCVGTPAAPDSRMAHPANAHADASPVEPLQPSLLALTNTVMVQPITTPVPEHQHGHEQPEPTPPAEEKK